MLIYLDSALVCTGRIIQMYFVNYRAKINCMKEFTEFGEFYNFCLFIIKNHQEYYRDFSNIEKIKCLRKILNKESLNRYYKVGDISKEIASSIESQTTCLKFSVDNMVKNLIEHPEITIKEYQNLSIYINNAEYILKKNNKNLIYFKVDNTIYQFVIKSTKIGDELFITTFHKASIKQLTKDIQRYFAIKKDSFDYEDSKYPSVT